jgi:hypothetical protein
VKEVKQQEENGIVNIMKSRGLGDDIAKFTKATGIKKVVDYASNKLNIPCGCEGRQKAMNMMFPYRNKEN